MEFGLISQKVIAADCIGQEVARKQGWISRTDGSPYFTDDLGRPWTPVGHNDAITWPELAGLFRRRDLPDVERHLQWLKDHGVTCIRLMLEYCQTEHRYLERPVGVFAPNMVRLWDDLFSLLEKVGLYVLLTPYDTFFMWTRWTRHPYNKRNGGPAATRGHWLTCGAMREAIRGRLAFASDRWGASPALFAWDLFNEINPAHGGDDVATLAPFITDVGSWLRAREQERYGRAHLQTVSIFDPDMLKHSGAMETIYRHPLLDFATTHFYEFGTIDDPKDTVAPALAAGRLTRRSLHEITDMRPFLDTEHGPIHRFKDKRHTLPELFDDECFRHFQWAHLASGGAGGGMRWPNRHPHVLTRGMRRAQAALFAFLPLIEWSAFRRVNLNKEVQIERNEVAAFACGDDWQAIIWLLSTQLQPDGRVRVAEIRDIEIIVPGLMDGDYTITLFDTRQGQGISRLRGCSSQARLPFQVTVPTDLAIAITPQA